MISLLLIFLLVAVVGATLVVLATKANIQRRARLMLALQPTCLLCNSRGVVAGIPPEYVCNDCGFDTLKTNGLTTELERYRALSFALDELKTAFRELRSANDANQIGRIPHVAEPLARAADHLRDELLDNDQLLNVPQPRADDQGVADLASYIEVVEQTIRVVRQDILAQMNTDGAVEAQEKLDFEHAVPADYDEL